MAVDQDYGLEPAKPQAAGDEYGLEPANKAQGAAVATEEEPVEPTEENLPGSTEKMRENIRRGVSPMIPPTKFEQEHPAIPKWYGFTPGNISKNIYEGAKGVVGSTAQGLSDLAFGEVNPETGEIEHGLGGLVGMNTQGEIHPLDRAAALAHKYVTGPAGEHIGRAEEEYRKGNLAGAIGHGTAAAVPLLGPWAASLGEQAGTGDIGGAAGQGLGAFAGGELMAEAPEAAKVAGRGALRATGGAGLGLGLPAEDLLTKGVRPRARAQGWQEAIASPGVQRAIKEANAASPIENIEDFHDAIGPMKEKIWNEQVQPALDRQGPRPVDMKPAAQAVRDAITPQMREFDPAGVAGLEELAGKLEGSRTVEEASNLQKYANAQLETYFGKYPAARRSAMNANPEIIGWETARRNIREQLNKTLDAAGETEAAPARVDYGHLTTIEKELERKVNPNERRAPVNLARMLGLIGAIPTHGLSLAAGALISHLNDPNVLLRRGISKLNPPEAAPFTPPAAFPAAQFPGAQGAMPLSTAPVQGPVPAPGPFEIERGPSRTGMWQTQVGPPPELETGAPRSPYKEPIGPQPGPPEPITLPIRGQQMPLHLPGGPEEAPLWNLEPINTPGNVPELPRLPGGGAQGGLEGRPFEGGPRMPEIGGPGREGELQRVRELRGEIQGKEPEIVPYTQPMPIAPTKLRPDVGITEDSVHHHELAHAIVGALNGFDPGAIASHRNPLLAGRGATAAVMYDLDQFTNRDPLTRRVQGQFRRDLATGQSEGLTDLFAAGAAANELLDGIPRDKNQGLRGDRRMAQSLFESLGFPMSRFDELWNAAIDRAKEKLTPKIQEIIKDEATRREDNLPVEYHYSENRIKNIVDRVRRAHAEPETTEPTAAAAGNEAAGAREGNRGGEATVAGGEGAGTQELRGAAPGEKLKPFRPPQNTYTFKLESAGEEPREIELQAIDRRSAWKKLNQQAPTYFKAEMTNEAKPEVGPPMELEPELDQQEVRGFDPEVFPKFGSDEALPEGEKGLLFSKNGKPAVMARLDGDLLVDIETAKGMKKQGLADQAIKSLIKDHGVTRAVPINKASEGLLEKNGFYNPSPGAANSEWRLSESALEEAPAGKFGPDDVRISTRTPTAMKATEDPHANPLSIDMDAVNNAKGLPEKLADVVKKYPEMQKTLKGAKTPGEVLSRFVDHVADNLEWLHNQMPPEVRDITRKWYESANQIARDLADEHGVDHKQTSGVMAALSPQKDWNMNVSLAKRVIDTVKNQGTTVTTPEMLAKAKELTGEGGNAALKGLIQKLKGKTLDQLSDPYEKAAWIRLYDEAHNSRSYEEIAPDGRIMGNTQTAKGVDAKVAWGDLGSISKAVSILEDGSRENISRQLGSMHKVRNFYNNIVDPMSEHPDVTIDTHAVAAGHIQPFSGNSHEVGMNFGGPSSALTGSNGTYPLYAEAYRKAAERLGLKPRELQSIVWEQVRDLFPAEWKTAANAKKVADIWGQYGKGKLGLDAARKQIVDLAGGFKKPEWLESTR